MKHEFNDKTSKIIGACIEVHKKLGKGFQEVIYQRALAKELDYRGIEFSREEWIPIYYKGRKIGRKRVDFIISNILVEIKAKSEFDRQDFVQAYSYLRSTYFTIGLLINFGAQKIQIKRFISTHKEKLTENLSTI